MVTYANDGDDFAIKFFFGRRVFTSAIVHLVQLGI